MEKFTITFYPDARSVTVNADTTILAAALSAGIYLNAACGGDGVCGRCKVIIRKGSVAAQPEPLLDGGQKDKGICLACLAQPTSDLEVEIPAESRLDFEHVAELPPHLKNIALGSEDAQFAQPAGIGFEHDPLTRKIFLELDPPTIKDNTSDFQRLCRQIHADTAASLPAMSLTDIRRLASLARDSDWKLTLTLGKKAQAAQIIDIQPQDTRAHHYGFAVDIGTTTISAQLIDLGRSTVLATRAMYNRQAAYGPDVITRIIMAEKPDGLARLHRACVDCINELIRDLCADCRIDLNNVSAAMVVGNTTMMHLLLSIDPRYIRRDPYVPTVNAVPVLRAADVGIQINPHGLLYCAPGISSYVGSDVTAGVLACGLDEHKDVCLLIDIGTNGEIVLGNREFLMATSASAGPAFEGSGVGCGMRSSSGAINRITVEPGTGQVTYGTIGNAPARGICGSGYIDLIAQLLGAGLLDKDGRLADGRHPRIRTAESGKEFVVAFASQGAATRDITVSEADIENLKRAKAAVYAATDILLKAMSLDLSQVHTIYIAGGFGVSLDVRSAVRIGLLPDVDAGKFKFVGNSALSGARAMLLSEQGYEVAHAIASRMAYCDLSVETSYMDEYMAALFFPHTDLARFPSVR